jgi:arylsulfatase A-like enzyme
MGLVNLGWRLPDREKTVPQLLRGAGYHTALFGIQHERPSSRTESLGYERAVAPAPAEELGHAIAEFIRAGPREPFLLSVGTFEPHRPFNARPLVPGERVFVPPYLPDNRIVREEMAGFTRLVQQLDDAVGMVLRALNQDRLAERTLVVFTTDHGIDMPRAKGTLYDPGIETALILRWPGVVPAGTSTDALLSNVDLLPTLGEALLLDVPEVVQGRSFWPLVRGAPYEPRDAVFAEKTHHTAYDPMRCIRTRTHKYIHNFGDLRHHEIPADGEMDCLAAVPDLCRERRPLEELYDLRSDPLESCNLADDSEFASIQADLRARLRAWMAQTGDPLLDRTLTVPRFL